LLPASQSSRRPWPRWWSRLPAFLLPFLVASLLAAPAVRALTVTGCSLTVATTDAGGGALGRAEAGDAGAAPAIVATEASGGGTRHDPLPVAWDGTIEWLVAVDGVPEGELDVRLAAFGMPIWTGSVPASGSLQPAAGLPFRLAGLLHVSGELRTGEQTCTASGWVRVMGNPVGTLPFLVGLLLAALGLVLVGAALRGAWPAGPAGGLLLGAGTAGLLISLALLPLDEWSPVAALVAGLLLGMGAAVYGRSRSAHQVGRGES
jgi:hypothetical protein